MKTNTTKISKVSVGLAVIAMLMIGGCAQDPPKNQNVFMGYIEDTEVNVTTRIPGKITGIFVNEGAYVKADQKIAQLDNKDMLDNLSAMKEELSNIGKNKKRLENLYTVGAVSQQKLDEIETAYEVVKDKMSALQNNINDMTITSPIAGKVNVRVLEPGQMMAPGMPVVVVTDTSISWARFSIPESYINQIQLGKVLTLTTGMANTNFLAEVIQILPMADFATKVPTNLQNERDVRAFSVKMKILNNKDRIKPGIYVYLKLANPNAQVALGGGSHESN
ncbi:MAG: efflux RND transporter periplasmic adaptor subunit [Bacteroidetes bacterium]|nr:efflux RND transporter periplasmic adaptor subunit [Bacteroidota bacterium]